MLKCLYNRVCDRVCYRVASRHQDIRILTVDIAELWSRRVNQQKKNSPGERKSDCTTGQHKSSNQHTTGGGAEQQPDNAESDVQSPDFVTAGGVSTKKKGHQTAFGCMILLKSAS